ncbi:MAG TPA: hypothetical protein EYG03_13225, partial [Planctomycetes bacterium]|nr:hypothetical protein [Planctomycetota bacterium]
MKRIIAAFIAVVLASVASHSSRGHAGDTNSDGRLVVHEWGTFTNFSGSDGVKLEYRPLVDNDLPDFVLDRGMQAG